MDPGRRAYQLEHYRRITPSEKLRVNAQGGGNGIGSARF